MSFKHVLGNARFVENAIDVSIQAGLSDEVQIAFLTDKTALELEQDAELMEGFDAIVARFGYHRVAVSGIDDPSDTNLPREPGRGTVTIQRAS